jgi:hypothetical protein
MFQVFHTDVAKVDRDVADVVMAIYICFKCMFQIFHLFKTNVAGVLSGYCKSRSRCLIHIYMHVASTCFNVFRCFIRMFASVSTGCCACCNDFQVFSGFLASVSDACFKCFICLLLYVASVASRCSKVDRLHVGSARRRGPTVGMLAANSTC